MASATDAVHQSGNSHPAQPLAQLLVTGQELARNIRDQRGPLIDGDGLLLEKAGVSFGQCRFELLEAVADLGDRRVEPSRFSVKWLARLHHLEDPVLEIVRPLAQVLPLIRHGLQIAGGTTLGGVHALLHRRQALAALLDLCLEALLARGQLGDGLGEPITLRLLLGQPSQRGVDAGPQGMSLATMAELVDEGVVLLYL